MGSCASVEETESTQQVPEDPIDFTSYFVDLDKLSSTHAAWVAAIEEVDEFRDDVSCIPPTLREAAPKEVKEICAADPAQWKRYMHYILSKQLRGLDEAFAQCVQIAPSLANTRRGARAQAGTPACDAFSGRAVNFLIELFGCANEIHGFFLLFRLLLRTPKQQELLLQSPSRLRSEGPLIDEWSVDQKAWIDGWVSLRAFSISDGRAVAKQLAATFDQLRLEDPQLKTFHKFLFRFLPKDTTLQQEAVSRDEAVRLWHCELQSKWALCDYFCSFVAHRYLKRFVTLDQWEVLVDFALAFRYEVNLLQYEGQASSAWPLLMDQFVEDTLRLLQERETTEGSMDALSQC